MRIDIGVLTLFFVVAGACQSSGPVKDSENKKSQSWSESMQSLQANLSDIEPLLFDSKEFNAPKNQAFLKEKIHQLAVVSKKLSHSPTLIHRDPTVRFVASQFSNTLQRADQAFAAGKTDFARYQVMKVTSSCVQCHTRMHQGPEFNFKKTEGFLKKMPVIDQAEFLIASRKFEEAFNLLVKSLEAPGQENIFAGQADRAAGLALMVAVQYEQNQKKASLVVNTIKKNSSMPYFLKNKAQSWEQSISQWKSEKKKPTTLAHYRELFKKKKSEVEAMRVIPGVLAILSKDLPNDQLGQALLLAGESYEALSDISTMDLHENYYESCIRNQPRSAVSKVCFQRLEESVRMGYTGSSGTHIPLDVEVWLNQLRTEAY